MIGILGAMPVEIEALAAHMDVRSMEAVSGIAFRRGSLLGQEILLGQCGVGKVNAAMAAEAMILRWRPDLVVNVGVAGALTERFGLGDIAVGRDLVQYDVDTSPLGDPVGMVSTVNRIDFPCATWAAEGILRAVKARTDLPAGMARIASGDRFMEDPVEYARIVERFGAEVCEMEACPIGQVCFINGVDCAVIRGISDVPGGPRGAVYGNTRDRAAANAARALEAFLESL